MDLWVVLMILYIVTELLVNFQNCAILLIYQLSKYLQLVCLFCFVLFSQKASSLLTKCSFVCLFLSKKARFYFSKTI